MKRFYSEYRYALERKEIKAISNMGVSGEELLRQITEKAFQDGVEKSDIAYSYFLIRAEIQMHCGNGTHYFIETTILADLILGMVRDFTPSILDVFSEHAKTAFIIHPPSPRAAVLVGMERCDGRSSAIISESGQTYIRGIDARAFKANERLEPTAYCERLAVGLALYCRFFPEAVRDGIPDCAKHPAHYRGKSCKTLRVSEQLIERAGPKPHIRAAHFRFLDSEKFVHKRGTYVLVAPTMVKGKSKIVVEVEQ